MPRIMQSVYGEFIESIPAAILLSLVVIAAALCVSCDADEQLGDTIPTADNTPAADPQDEQPDIGKQIEKLIADGEHQKALETADTLVNKSPRNAEALLLRGETRLHIANRTENHEAAAKLIRGAIEDYRTARKHSHEQDYRPHGCLARAYCAMAALDRSNGRRYYETALDAIDAAEQTAGETIPALATMRANIQKALGQYDKAAENWAKLAETNPDDPAPVYHLAQDALEHDDITGALAKLNEALRRDPKCKPALLGRASIFVEMNRFDEAMADIEALQTAETEGKVTPGLVKTLTYLEGILRLNHGRWMKRRANPTNTKAVEAAHDEAAAGMILLEALKDDDNEAADFFVLLAQLEISTSNTVDLYEKAFKSLDGAGAGKDAVLVMPRLHLGMGMALFAEEDRENDAVEEIDKAVKYADDIRKIMAHPQARVIDKLLARRACAEAVLTRGRMDLEVWRDTESARKAFRRYKRLRPWNAEAANVQELLYECEFADIVGRELSYEQCAENLKHPYYKIRAAAIKILSKSDEARCKRAIAGMLADDNDMVVRMAIEAMKSRRIRENMAGLGALFHRSNEVVAIEAMKCAAVLKERATIPALIDALEDERIGIREVAINALMDITTRSMFYHYGDSAEKRAEAVRKWREWWAEESKNDSPGQ